MSQEPRKVESFAPGHTIGERPSWEPISGCRILKSLTSGLSFRLGADGETPAPEPGEQSRPLKVEDRG